MKKILLTLLLATPLFSFAQIPNSGFENWTTVDSVLLPDSWESTNMITSKDSVYTCTKGTPGSPGSSYLKLTSETVGSKVVNGVATCGKLDTTTLKPKSGFAFNERPESFTGKWQHMIFGSSQGSIEVNLTKWDSVANERITIATAKKTLSGMAMSWATFTIGFSYANMETYPDSCTILLKASGSNPTQDDYLWVDNLGFSGTVDIIDTSTGISDNNFTANISIFPNPANDVLNINFNLLTEKTISVELLDLTGRIIQTNFIGKKTGEINQKMDISTLSSGTYFVKINAENESVTKKIFVE